MLFLGALVSLVALLQIDVFGRAWDLHTMVAGALLMMGLTIAAGIVGVWIDRGFGQLSEERLAVLASALVIVGIQIFFTSFLLSILGLRRRG
jgi:hypothetical protein